MDQRQGEARDDSWGYLLREWWGKGVDVRRRVEEWMTGRCTFSENTTKKLTPGRERESQAVLKSGRGRREEKREADNGLDRPSGRHEKREADNGHDSMKNQKRNKRALVCYNCGGKGHTARLCPTPSDHAAHAVDEEGDTEEEFE